MNGQPAFPASPDPSYNEVADWCECKALLSATDFKRGDLKSVISREDVRSPDLLEEQVWDELGKRSELNGYAWPLEFDGDRLSRKEQFGDDGIIYLYLCLLALGDIESEDRSLFEELVSHVLAKHTADNATRIGHPARPGVSKSFRTRVAAYAKASNLTDLEHLRTPLPDDKDLGMDVVGWLPMGDGRGAYLHFLVQCATGRNWDSKLHDIDPHVIAPHLNWAVPPVRVFCVPVVVSVPEYQWIRLARQAGWVWDRPRLLNLAAGMELPESVRAEVVERTEELCV